MNRLMKVLFTILAFILSHPTWAQMPVEMADTMRADGKIRVVIGVVTIIFIGIVVYLIRLEMRMKGIEKRIQD